MLPYSTHQKLHAHRAKPKYRLGFFQNMVIYIRAGITVMGLAFKKFNLNGEHENYDEFSDRADKPERWYRERYPTE